MILDFKKYNIRQITEASFLAAFSCYLILQYLQGTTFTIGAPEALLGIIRSVLLGVGLLRLVFLREATPKTTTMSVAVFFGLGLFFLIDRGDCFIIDMALVMLGAIGVPFKRIGGLYVFIAAFLGILSLVCSLTGVIPDYVFYTDIGSRTIARHSFGIIYPTDLFAHLFYLVVTYLFVRFKRITYIEISIFAVLGIVLFVFTGARADFACMFFALIMALICKICKYKDIKLGDRIKTILGALIMPIGALFMIALTWFFKPYNLLYSKIDSMMTQRLSLGKVGFDLYGFSPLGAANFAENGNANGGITKYEYVFYDSSYIKMLFKYGYIVLLVVLIIFALIAVRLVKNKMFYAIIFITAITLSCVIEHHIFELSYNISFLLLTADISSCLQSDSLIIINNKKML